jgi:peptide/nickel transport system permease protein
MVIQRIVELFVIIPDVPLGLALAAFLPPDLSPVLLMSGIALVLAVVSWGNVARQIRGKTLALRHSDYIRAAICIGATTPRVLFRHILPSLYSHLIVLATLTLPQVILAESSLSFLRFGVRPPMSSWGSLLKDAQNFRVIALYPWEMLPGIAIMITVLSLNFVGDALRDAFDPYSTN